MHNILSYIILNRMELGMKKFKVMLWLQILISLECILLLSGCNKIIEWGKQNFEQAPKYCEDFVKAAHPFLRSKIVYSQFETVACFDALFLTDDMRMLYMDYHKKFHSLTSSQESLMRTRTINENKYFISFYVLALQKEHLYESTKSLFTGTYQKQSELLGTKHSSWNVSMLVGNQEYIAESIRIVDLPMEYRNFFGKQCHQFNTAYLVRFDLKDSLGNIIFEPFKKYKVTLRLKSAEYQVELLWKNIVYCKN